MATVHSEHEANIMWKFKSEILHYVKIDYETLSSARQKWGKSLNSTRPAEHFPVDKCRGSSAWESTRLRRVKLKTGLTTDLVGQIADSNPALGTTFLLQLIFFTAGDNGVQIQYPDGSAVKNT